MKNKLSSIVVHFGGFLGGGGGFNLAPPNAGFAAHSLSGSAAGGFGSGSSAGTGGSVQPLQKVERVRNIFPETWLWTNKTTGYLLCCTFALEVDAVVPMFSAFRPESLSLPPLLCSSA